MSREAMQQALEALQSKRFTACGWRTECDKAITALRTALAEQVQPAYWGVFEGGNLHDFFTVREMAEEMAHYKGGHAVVGPIYTAPQAPQPLTDEDIYRITRHCGVSKHTATSIARAVEAEVLKRMVVQR